MASIQFLVESDVLAEYLTHEDSLLRRALARHGCYTTMLNAMELFRAASTPADQEAVLQMLHLTRVLGFNARQAKPFSEVAREIELRHGIRPTSRETLMLGMARASKLELLTKVFFDRYTTMGVVNVHRTLPMPDDRPTESTTSPITPGVAESKGPRPTTSAAQHSFA
jgi:predicted nucleic acid-binding protein